MTTLTPVVRTGFLAVCATVMVAAVLALPVAAGAQTAQETMPAEVAVSRYSGADRYATSLLVADAVAADAGGSLTSVVMVSGRTWSDAVVAAPVAGVLGAPVLMTPPGELRADAAAFLGRTGVSSVVVVGGTSGADAVSPAVVSALEALGVSVERVGRVDRYATGVVAARRVSPVGEMAGHGTTAIVANGDAFADALVAGPFAARGAHPVLLTQRDKLHAGVAGYLSSAGISHVVLMGGPAALSETVESSITDLGISVTRLAGATRYDTAVKAAELVQGRYVDAGGEQCFSVSTIGLARARVPFDSFSAAPLLGRLCAPLVLADPAQVPTDTAAFLDTARATHTVVDVRVLGGDAAVSQAAIDAYLNPPDPVLEDDAEDSGQAEEADEADEADDGAATAPVVLRAGTCGGDITDEPRVFVPSTNAEDPAWSPDCSRLVFTQDGALWTMSNNGTNRQRLLHGDGAYLSSGAWSPDGTKIAYVRGYQDGSQWVAHIWSVGADGTGSTQLTTGAIWDASPRWSPDGGTIVFDRVSGGPRHVMRMSPTGDDLEAVTADGGPNFDAAFSPDGTQLAYVAISTLVVAAADGTNPRAAIAPVSEPGGLSWSPDGKRFAFIRTSGGFTALTTADTDGLNEEIVFRSTDRVRAPRWSPDGARIAFHTIEADGKHRLYIAGASGEPVEGGVETCRPGSTMGTTAGFPLDDWAAPSVGSLRIAALFLDFPDAQATHTTQDEAVQGLPYAEDYLEAASYGQLDVEFVSHDAWLRAENDYSAFSTVNVLGNQAVDSSAVAHAIELAGQNMDFSGIDAVMVILPSSLFGGGGFAHQAISALDESWPSSLINSVHLGDEREPYEWGSVAAHEVTHNLGLADLYPYDANLHARAEAPAGMTWVAAQWGRMNMWSWYLAAEHDPRMAHAWTYPGGYTSTSYRLHLRIEEMLAWSRWQLGWLSESQVRCTGADEATVTLSPIAQPGDAVAMASIPLSAHEVIVMESRRRLGYDAGRHYEAADSGVTTTFPRLITEGVLVYTVDSWLGAGALPLKVAGDSGNGQVDDFPVLEAGESVTLRGYTITVVADDGDTHTVTITRNV
ncbi:cell wall-binding repeat-containing protein [Candidatus Poriferisodalis sp.]|uniref:cell wall-binding repeat-containing protein n=1 Tax=Candidatus Poriferisodalis sp. TaxID=3101277 RepID=UPI003B52AA37